MQRLNQKFIINSDVGKLYFSHYLMGGKSSAECIVRTDKPFYLAGDIVNGSVYVNAKKAYPCQRIILYVDGIQACFWKGPPDVKNRPGQRLEDQYIGKNQLLQNMSTLYQWDKKSFLHGQYVFPFGFSLPSYLPGSFSETKQNYNAEIKYKLKVVCFSPNPDYKNLQHQQVLVIRQPQKNYSQPLYGQVLSYPKTFCSRMNGVNKTCCYFDKNYYQRGNDSIVICQVDNFKCDLPVSQVKCTFIKRIVLRSNLNETKTFTEIINDITFPGIEAKNAYVRQQAKRLQLPLKQRNRNEIHPTTSGNMVNCQYFIQVAPLFRGCCVSGVQPFKVRLVILQKPLVMEKIAEPEGWNPQVFAVSTILLDHKAKNNRIDQMAKINEISQNSSTEANFH